MNLHEPDLRVRSTKLQGFPPFPTWNGTISSPACGVRGLCSVLGADGELVVLQTKALDAQDASVRVLKVLPPVESTFSSFCQCWMQDGSVLAAAYDRSVVFYDTEEFRVRERLQLKYSVAAMDVVKFEASSSVSRQVEILLVVGTQFGSFLYKVLLPSGGAGVDANASAGSIAAPVAHVLDDVAVCQVKFSPDGRVAAIGTFDGRLYVRGFDSHCDDTLATFGRDILSKVLASPRVTSISFSACHTKLVVAAKQGNVYVFTRASTAERWQPLPSCQALSANPKPKSSAQTLVCCWGPVLVVSSRAVTSRLEMYDLVSGRLLHSLQLTAAAHTPSGTLTQSLSQWVDQPLVTGVCSCQALCGRLKLLCHDTDANIVLVEWSFLDVIGR